MNEKCFTYSYTLNVGDEKWKYEKVVKTDFKNMNEIAMNVYFNNIQNRKGKGKSTYTAYYVSMYSSVN